MLPRNKEGQIFSEKRWGSARDGWSKACSALLCMGNWQKGRKSCSSKLMNMNSSMLTLLFPIRKT